MNGGVISGSSPVQVAEAFLAAFNAGDPAALRACLADDATALVTGPDGEPFEMAGAESYVAAVTAMNLPAVDYSVTLTQAPVPVGDDQVLVMVEIRARRDDRTLYNYAAHLLRVVDGLIVRLSMVEAKPEESDRFWGWRRQRRPARRRADRRQR